MSKLGPTDRLSRRSKSKGVATGDMKVALSRVVVGRKNVHRWLHRVLEPGQIVNKCHTNIQPYRGMARSVIFHNSAKIERESSCTFVFCKTPRHERFIISDESRAHLREDTPGMGCSADLQACQHFLCATLLAGLTTSRVKIPLGIDRQESRQSIIESYPCSESERPARMATLPIHRKI
jgi:hypothetical protein